MKILFTVCGRAGSKGIKNKNIRNFLKIPLPYYTLSVIDLYKKAHLETSIDIVVNTDSIELIELVQKSPFGKVDIIERDFSLAGDRVSKVAVVLDCLSKMEQIKRVTYDMVVDLDLTSPLRTLSDLEHLIERKVNHVCDVVISVTEARRNPYFNQVKRTNNGYKKVIESNFIARQQAPQIYDMNASMYAYGSEFLRSGKGVLDGKVEIILMYDTAVLDLDHENDFELMEVIADYIFKNKPEFSKIREHIEVGEEK